MRKSYVFWRPERFTEDPMRTLEWNRAEAERLARLNGLRTVYEAFAEVSW